MALALETPALDSRDRAKFQKPFRVLVVDDQLEVANTLAELVRLLGYETLAESDPQRAVEFISDRQCDVVLCDYRMPELSGADLYRAAIAVSPKASQRFIFVSGDSEHEEIKNFVHLSGVTCLRKPFRLTAVKDALERVVSLQ
jgi:CheY-like chemotaxis protein